MKYVNKINMCLYYLYQQCFCFFSLTNYISASVQFSRSVVSDSVCPHRWQPTRLPRPWDSPGKNTGVGFHFLLQGIFLTQSSNPVLLHCRQILYCLSHQGSPMNCCMNKIDYNPQHLHNLTMAATNVNQTVVMIG